VFSSSEGSAHLNATLKGLLYVIVSAAGLLLVAIVGVFAWVRWEQHLPSDQDARQQFGAQRTEFVRFVSLLRQDTGARMILSGGAASGNTGHLRIVPEYRDLMREIGAKYILVRDDGSIKFALWGLGCAICSDSYKGMRYTPQDSKAEAHGGWVPKLVDSLGSNDLPQEHGSVADGLYVVKLEPEWFIYRLEIHE
jgi:hypothetical protein